MIDRTSLSGRFDVELTFARGLVATADDPCIDIFTAVSHQLGLKLEPGRHRMPVIVIESVNRPTPN